MGELPPIDPSLVTDELVAFLAQGVSVLVGTCDRAGVPACMRATGLLLTPDRQQATVYLPEVTSRNTVTNVRDNPRVAVYASYPLDHKSYQMKGPVLDVSPAPESARALIEAYVATWSSVLEVIGMPSEMARLLAQWPSVALTLRIDELYLQTPGPGAGAAVGGPP